MNAKAPLGIKIAAVAAVLLLGLAYALWTVAYRRQLNRDRREDYRKFVDLTRQ